MAIPIFKCLEPGWLSEWFVIKSLLVVMLMCATQTAVAKTITHNVGPLANRESCLTAVTPFYKIAIDTQTGEIVKLEFTDWSRDVVGGPLPVLGWDSLIEAGPTQFIKQPGKLMIEQETPEKLVVCVTAKGGASSQSTEHLVIKKRYTLRADTPVIHAQTEVQNTGPLQRFQYRLYHGLKPAKLTNDLYTLYPRPQGVVRYDAADHPYEDTIRHLAEVNDFTSPWVATMADDHHGVILQTDTDQIIQLRNLQHYPSVEFTYRETALRPKSIYRTFFNIIPVEGLDSCDFVSPQVVIDVLDGDAIQLNVLGLTSAQGVSVALRFVTQDGKTIKDLGRKSVDLLPNKIVKMAFDDPRLPKGSYGLQGTVTGKDGKVIGEFTSPYTVGDGKASYRVATVAQRSQTSALAEHEYETITPETYKKTRQKRKVTKTLVLRRWSENTSYHVVEALKQRPDTQVKIITYFGSGGRFMARDFPLDPIDFLNLDAIYLVDAPASLFSRLDLINLHHFVNAGGLVVVFTGSMSATTYQGSKLEEILPVTHADTDPLMQWNRAAFRGRIPQVPMKLGPDAGELFKGLEEQLPLTTVFPAKLKAGAQLLLGATATDKGKAVEELRPVLAVRREGQGRVVSFAIRPDRRDLIDPFTTWPSYPALLARLLDLNCGESLTPYPPAKADEPIKVARLEPNILEHDFNFRTDIREKGQRLNEWAMGRGDVFTWGSAVPLPVDIVVTEPATLGYELSITDAKGKLIHRFKSRTLEVKDRLKLKDTWTAPALARGAYKVVGKLSRNSQVVDEFSETLYCEPESDWRDYYPINFSYFGYGGRDITTIQRGVQEVHILKDMGFNTIGYGYFADEILKAGLDHSTVNDVKMLAWYGLPNFRAPLNQARIKAAVMRSQKYYGRRPRMGLVQTDDETQLPPKAGIGDIDKAAFLKQYGYEMPTDPKDPHWYEATTFRAQGMAQNMREARVIMKKAALTQGMKRDRAIAFPTVHHNLPHPTWDAFHDDGSDASPRYVLAERWSSSEPADIDHTIAWAWSATDFSDNRLGLILGIIPQRGDEWKSALGFWLGISHGAEFLEGYTWVSTAGYLIDSPVRVKTISQTLNTISQVAPIFLHLRNQRARVAMLCPWKTSQALDSTNQREVWPADYAMLRRAVGQVDILFDQQLEKQLPNIDMLVIPRGSVSVHSKTQKMLKAWVAKGGLLVAAPGTASLDETRQPNRTLADPTVAHRVDMVAMDAVAQIRSLAQGRTAPLAISDNNKIVCNLHFDDEASPARVLTAVNLDRDQQSTKLSLALPDAGYKAIDLVSGESIAISHDGKMLHLPLTIDGAWGRVILLTPTLPVSLNVEANVSKQKLTYSVSLSGKNNAPLDYPSVCTITVTDPAGNDHFEYGGKLVATDGKLSRTLALPINEQPGTWTVSVRQGASTLTSSTTFEIKGDSQ